MSVEFLTHFFKILFVFLLLSFKNSLYILDNSALPDMFCKYFLTVCGFSFDSFDSVFCRVEILNLNAVHLISSFMPLVLELKSHC